MITSLIRGDVSGLVGGPRPSISSSDHPVQRPDAVPGDALIPSLIADAGEQVAWRYVDSYTANIRNPNIRRAYARALHFSP